MKTKNNFLYVIIGILVIGIFASFFIGANINKTNSTTNTNTTQISIEEPKPYKNSEFVILTKSNLLTLLKQSSSSTVGRASGLKTLEMTSSMDVVANAPAPGMDQSTGGLGDTDYSTTNVQVRGIDEGDIVKTNGEKIFIGKDNKLVVVNNVTPPLEDIYNLEISKEVTNYEYYTGPQETIRTILLDDDLLYLVTTKYRNESKFDSSLLYPQMIYIPTTVVTTYEINEDSLDKLSAIEVDGEYYQSRLKEGYIYLITNTNNFFYSNPILLDDIIISPIKEEKAGKISTTERTMIMPKDGTPDNKNIYTITTIKYDESQDSVIDSLDLLLDYSSTIYMSEDNLYIAHKENNYWGPWFFRGYYNDNLDVFKAIYKDVYPNSIQEDIEDNLENPEKLKEILNEYYNSLEADEKEELYKEISAATDKYYQEKQRERQKTNISKIELEANGKLGEITTGYVTGELLNQFSLDEDKDGYLRVAITYRDEDYKSNSGIVILDSDLEEYSKLDDLAKDERIYSVRFMGDKVFLVTFKQIDPFFVIDLSDRENPEVLGYLKIPGYSSYLHPISDTLILGVGQDTKENQWGGTSTDGVKVTLFDVSDYSDPKEVATYKVSAENSYTQVQEDHKAFLYIEKNNLIVLPVSEYFNTRGNETNFYVLEIKDDDIVKKEKLSHNQDYGNLLRSLYIGDELYTISNNHIVTYNFNTEDTTEVSIN
ncbi:MAG TPA: beta-propeller domain-containing protein [archaeon]|nr:beta-propeller domain-containing protein [archaeon]